MGPGASPGRPFLTQLDQSPFPALPGMRLIFRGGVGEAVLSYKPSPHYPTGSDSQFHSLL